MKNPIEALDGWRIEKGIGRRCFGCDTPFNDGDKVVVSPGETDGKVEAVFGYCPKCANTHIPEQDREKGYDQYRLKFKVKTTPHGTVLDSSEAKVLDHSPPDEGV